MRLIKLVSFLMALYGFTKVPSGLVDEIQVEGQVKVGKEAIVKLLTIKVGQSLERQKISQSILAIHKLGYFDKVDLYAEQSSAGKLVLVVKVREKPTIAKIEFEGFEELKEEDLRKEVSTKLYSIVNESTINNDLRMMSKKYGAKGHYLAGVSYTLKPRGKNEVDLIFHADEKSKLRVGEVHFRGNKFFSQTDLMEYLALQPYTRWSATLGAPSLYQDDLLKRDLEYLAYYYKDHGFAQVKLGTPIVHMDPDRRFVRLTFYIEEGERFNVGSVHVSGDVGPDLYTADDLLQKMKLKEQDTFKISKFSGDVKQVVDSYGDLGYAYVDVNPKTRFDAEAKLVHIDYHISKGRKVYFGKVDFKGNSKTRYNVLLRELKIKDGELYSGSKMSESTNNLKRLGFFSNVKAQTERSPDDEEVVNPIFTVEEKSTGSMQASIGFSPGDSASGKFFGSGTYEEKNQSGRAWNTRLNAKYSNKKNWELTLGFYNPQVNDSPWSLGLNLSLLRKDVEYSSLSLVPEQHRLVGIQIGRLLFEEVRGIVAFQRKETRQLEERQDAYLLDDQRAVGVENSVRFSLLRRSYDNFIDPTEGSSIKLSHRFAGWLLGGDQQYMETNLEGKYYFPIDYTEKFRTYFKLTGFYGKLWSFGNEKIPSRERYRLGYYELRGYRYGTVGPKERRGLSPHGSYIDHNIGGDKQLYFQFEYFVPLIPQAGLKALVFADIGTTTAEGDNLPTKFGDYKKDVGFGIRWQTPMAPFRFEWGFPYDDATGELGDFQFILNIGY